MYHPDPLADFLKENQTDSAKTLVTAVSANTGFISAVYLTDEAIIEQNSEIKKKLLVKPSARPVVNPYATKPPRLETAPAPVQTAPA